MAVSKLNPVSTASNPPTVVGVPSGLTLRNTYTSTTSGLSYPVSQVYVVAVGGGGAGVTGNTSNGAANGGGTEEEDDQENENGAFPPSSAAARLPTEGIFNIDRGVCHKGTASV